MTILIIALVVALVVVATLMSTYRKLWINARAVNTELIIRLTEKCGGDSVRDIMFEPKDE